MTSSPDIRRAVRALVQCLRAVLLAAAVVASVIAAGGTLAVAQDWSVEDRDRDRKMVERLLAILEKDPLNDYAFGQLRQRAAAIGGLEAVIERYREKLAADPTSLDTLLLLARLHQVSGDPDLALRYLDQAADLSERWQIYKLRGTLRADAGDISGAQRDFESALGNASARDDKIAILRELGDLARRDGRDTDAVAAYQRIAELAPEDRYLRWELASIFYDQQLWHEALEQYQAAAKLAGRNAEERARAELEIAGLYERLGQWGDAIATYDAIIDRTTDSHWLNREARARLVQAYRASGDLEGLLARLERRLEKNPRDSWALGVYARLLDDLARTEDAIVAYERWLERSRDDIEPDVQQAYLRLVRMHRSRDEVAAIYERLIERTRDADLRLLHVLDLVRFMRTTSSVPLEAYTRLRDYERTQLGAISAAGGIDRRERLAVAYLEFGPSADTIDRASALYEEILGHDPENLSAHLALLTLALDRGELSRQEEQLERIVAMERFDPSVAEELVTLYQARSAPELSARVLELALARFPEDPDLRLLRANLIAADQTPGAAIEAWRELVLTADSDPHLRTASRAYLELLAQHQAVESSTAWFERAVAEDPTDWRTARLLFFLYAWQGHLDDALQLLSSLQLHVPNTVMLEEQAFALLQVNHPDKALTLLRTLAAKRPHVAWRYALHAAELLVTRGRTDAALALLEEALAAAPDNADALGTAGQLYLRLRMHDDAERVLGEALRLAPRNPVHRITLASALLEQQDPQRADRAYGLLIDALVLPIDIEGADEIIQLLEDAATASGRSTGQLGDDLRDAADRVLRRDVAQHLLEAAQRMPATFR